MRITFVADSADSLFLLKNRGDIIWRNALPQDAIADADLFIWDYVPGMDIQNYIEIRRSAQHLVLTDHKYLPALADIQGSSCILLKPVNAFTLRAFIDLAFKTWQTNRQAQEVEILRHDRDALLQYVLEVNLKLQEYDQERSNFLARALHDFRAPLTALHGYCGLLAEGKLGFISGPQQELLSRMSYSTKRLARLAAGTMELLLQGRVERSAKFREGNIQQTVKHAVNDVYHFLQSKRLTVDVDLTPPLGTLSFESEQIQQVFINLLENSCKFTPAGGIINVAGTSIGPGILESDAYRIDVNDSGPGIPPELTERIFEEYATYSGVLDRSAGGLGLAICRRIITAHNGLIWATSSSQGGTFSIILPCTRLSEELIDSNAEHEFKLGVC